MSEIAPEARAEIERRLQCIAEDEGIRILMAVESGSRAWGFPSPDSDYDARFIYVRPPRDYLRLTPPRDVVERPIIDLFDVNGWDINKTLALLLNHNAVVAEWINSPIRYQPDDPVIAQLADLADRHFNPRGYARHYASLGRNNVQRWDETAATLSVKRYFYALRPALCVRALRIDPAVRPPMQLQALMRVTDLPAQLTGQIEELVALKSQTKEAAPATRSRELESLIIGELARAEEVPERLDAPAFAAEAEALLFDLLDV
jgi:predicted nucleotidyltransferase